MISKNLFPSGYNELVIPPDNRLPYTNYSFFDRFFQLIRPEEIVAIYSALLSEEKKILVVCEEQYDIVPIVLTLQELFYPFEWCLPMIPFLVSNPRFPNSQLFELIHHIQSIIIGIHISAYEEMKLKLEDDLSGLEEIVVLDLSYTNRDPRNFNSSYINTSDADDGFYNIQPLRQSQ